MPVTHTEKPRNVPGRYGEFKFGKWISSAGDQDTNLWFNVNHLYGIGEIDVLVSHPSFGFLAIEIKGHSINQVNGYSGDGKKVAFGEKIKPNPALVAHERAQKLKGWFSSQKVQARAPWVHSLAMWPNIKRGDWVTRFGEESAASKDSHLMGFEEDLVSFDHFLDTVNAIIHAPRFGATPPKRVFDVDGDALLHFVDLLSDRSDLELPVGEQRKEVAPGFRLSNLGGQQRQLPQHWDSKRLVIEGPAGSGKTQTLLRVGLEHLAHGRRVLFCCFNKTLAAEVRREISGNTIATLDSEFLAFDYYELAKFLQPSVRVPPGWSEDESYDRYLGSVVRANRADQVEEFEVVLVDESQDISDEQWELVRSVCGRETYVAIAMGKRQELYRSGPCEAVARWAEKAPRSKLQRRFRDAAQGFFVGQAFSHMNFISASTDATASIDWMREQKKKFRNQHSKANQLDFGGLDNAGSIIRINDARTVEEEVKELAVKMAKHKGPVNAMIIFPRKTSRAYSRTTKELGALALSYFDLLLKDNRRTSPPRSAIRVITAHSARGLEADYVLVFDFEEICKFETIGAKLSYIVLSRARIETTVSRASGGGPYMTALREIISAYED